MKRIIATLCILPMLLGGCSAWLDGSYHSVTPHVGSNDPVDTQSLSANNYDALLIILSNLVLSGAESGVISVAQYDQEKVSQDMDQAIAYTLTNDPIAAYAAKEISYELGASAGQPALAVTLSYRYDRSHIQKIVTVPSMALVHDAVANALERFDSGIVLHINNYSDTDLAQWVNEYAAMHPDKVVECPTVTAKLYPETGVNRVLELKFTYQTNVDSLKSMQQSLTSVFEAATLYVSGDGNERQKFSQLYAFLMERFDYQIKPSVTPAYSLLYAGIGDPKAFANVYAAMCKNAGLECVTISGTKDDQPWHWNMVSVNGNYYHVDLLQCKQNGVFRVLDGSDMTGYSWDYATLPATIE